MADNNSALALAVLGLSKSGGGGTGPSEYIKRIEDEHERGFIDVVNNKDEHMPIIIRPDEYIKNVSVGNLGVKFTNQDDEVTNWRNTHFVLHNEFDNSWWNEQRENVVYAIEHNYCLVMNINDDAGYSAPSVVIVNSDDSVKEYEIRYMPNGGSIHTFSVMYHLNDYEEWECEVNPKDKADLVTSENIHNFIEDGNEEKY